MRAYDELTLLDADCGLDEVPYGTNALQQEKLLSGGRKTDARH